MCSGTLWSQTVCSLTGEKLNFSIAHLGRRTHPAGVQAHTDGFTHDPYLLSELLCHLLAPDGPHSWLPFSPSHWLFLNAIITSTLHLFFSSASAGSFSSRRSISPCSSSLQTFCNSVNLIGKKILLTVFRRNLTCTDLLLQNQIH